MIHRAIDAEERAIEAAGAFAMLRQKLHEFVRERQERGFDILAPQDRLGEAALDEIGRRLETAA